MTRKEMIKHVQDWLTAEAEAYSMGCLVSAEFTPGTSEEEYEEMSNRIKHEGFDPNEIWIEVMSQD